MEDDNLLSAERVKKFNFLQNIIAILLYYFEGSSMSSTRRGKICDCWKERGAWRRTFKDTFWRDAANKHSIPKGKRLV